MALYPGDNTPATQRLVISYGVRDCEAKLATVLLQDVMELLA
jgi:hypothetical protein